MIHYESDINARNRCNKTALILGIENKHLDVVKFLLAFADIILKLEIYKTIYLTPLWITAKASTPLIFSLVLDRCLCICPEIVNQSDPEQGTLLYQVVRHEWYDAVARLLANSAATDTVDDFYCPAVHYASSKIRRLFCQ